MKRVYLKAPMIALATVRTVIVGMSPSHKRRLQVNAKKKNAIAADSQGYCQTRRNSDEKTREEKKLGNNYEIN